MSIKLPIKAVKNLVTGEMVYQNADISIGSEDWWKVMNFWKAALKREFPDVEIEIRVPTVSASGSLHTSQKTLITTSPACQQ